MTTTETGKSAVAAAKGRVKWKNSAKKWGRTTVDTGVTMIPTALFTMQQELGITPKEMNILLQLISTWWKVKRLPFLSKKTIGQRINLDPRNVHKHLKSLEAKGLIEIKERKGTHGGRLSNSYDLKPLADKLKPLAVKMKARSDAKKGGGE